MKTAYVKYMYFFFLIVKNILLFWVIYTKTQEKPFAI